MGIDFSALALFNQAGLWLLDLFLAPVHLLQALLSPWAPGLLATVGLAPGALQPQIAVVLAIILWSLLLVAATVACHRIGDRLKVLREELQGFAFKLRMRSRFSADWLSGLLRRLRPAATINTASGEINLPVDAVRVLESLAAQPRGAAASAPELAGLLALEVRIVQRYLGELADIGLVEAAIGTSKRYPNFCVSHSGAQLLDLGFSQPADPGFSAA